MSAQQKFVDLVNRDNPGLNLKVTDVDFSQAIDNPDVGIQRDSRITLTSKNLQRFKGPTTLWYNRIDLNRIFGGGTVSVVIDHAEGDVDAIYYTTDLVGPLNQRFGLDLEEQDVVVTAIPHDDGIGEIEVFIKAGNPAWKGSVRVSYSGSSEELSSVIVNATLFGFNYPNSDLTKGQAAVYSYAIRGLDTDIAYWTAQVPGPVLAAMVEPFNRGDNVDDTWIHDITAPRDFNLAGGTVLYNGTNNAASILAAHGVITNPSFTKVCIIALSNTLCSNFGGKLTIYYA